jgi:hypothetical protein
MLHLPPQEPRQDRSCKPVVQRYMQSRSKSLKETNGEIDPNRSASSLERIDIADHC